MNKFDEYLLKLKDIGFEVNDENNSVNLTTDHAREYYESTYTGEEDFIIGFVLAENENLSMVEYDVAFHIIEEQYGMFTAGEYTQLHEYAELNDLEKFKEKVKELFKDKEDERYEMVKEIEAWQTDFEESFEQLIGDIEVYM